MESVNVRQTRNINARLLLRDDNDVPASNIQTIDNSFSIVDYAQEPLLSLTEACQPLIPIIDHISDYIAFAVTNTPNEPPHGLTCDQSAAIRLYTMEWHHRDDSLYFILNKTLKSQSREKLRPWHKYLKLLLTALVRVPCEPVQTVWRGVKMDVSQDFASGTNVTWWGFSSCTKSLSLLENNVYLGDLGPRTLFSIEISNGRDVSAHSHFVQEDEILLLPGTNVEVLAHLTQASGLRIIHLKQKMPDVTLLVPPFKGAYCD